MCAQSSAQENSPIGVTPAIRPHMPWRVARVEPLPEFRLCVTFRDKTTGIVDMSRLVHAADAGVFADLTNPDLFAQVSLEHGAVTWPGEIDLAPDAMYRAIAATGQWVL